MKKICLILTFSLMPFCFARSNLAGYLKNDLELKKLALEVRKAELSSEETSIDNGFNITLSSGTATLQTRNDDLNVTLTPSVTAKIPQLNGLELSVSSSVKIRDGENSTENTKISLSADLISGSARTRQAKLMSAERSLLEARRSLQNRALEAEKEYYTKLKALFNSAVSIISAQKRLYDDTIDFEDIKAKGYSAASSKYRLAELKVLDDTHNVETKKRELEHDCAVFASKCGEPFSENSTSADFLPAEIIEVQAVDVLSFEKEQYKKIENARYTHEYNSLVRSADRNFTLSANAGYTINNTSAKTTGTADYNGSTVTTVSTDRTDTIDAGLTAGWNGLTLGAGVSFPAGNTSAPIYTVSAAVDPSVYRKRKVTGRKNSCSEEEELIEIQSAEEEYDTSVVDQQKSLADIQWSKDTNKQTFAMYEKLEKELSEYLKSGIIKRSEYLSAFANKEQYRIQMLINDIDLIIYNNTTKLLFCRDDEIKGGL